MNNDNFWSIIKDYKFKSVFIQNLIKLFAWIIITFSAVSLSFLGYHNYMMKNKLEVYNLYAHKRVCMKVEEVSNFINNCSAILSSSDSLKSFIYSSYKNQNELSVHTANLSMVMNNLISTSNYLDSIYILNQNTSYIFSNNFVGTTETFFDLDWYYAFLEKNRTNFVKTRTIEINNRSHKYLTFCNRLYINTYLGGAVVFNVNDEALKNYIIDESSYNSRFYIISNDDVIVFSNDLEAIDRTYTAYAEETLKNAKNALTTKLAANEFKIVTIHSNSLYTQQTSVYILFVLILLLSLVSIFIISYNMSKKFYMSLVQIIKILQNPQNENNEIHESNNELQYIMNSISSLKRSSESIEIELAFQYAQLKKSQLSAMQGQINPHFIFNTLNLISLTDFEQNNKPTRISEIVDLLSDILRETLKSEENIIDLKTEIAYLDKYISLQNIKYENRFDIAWNIEVANLGADVIKFMLQPIVENAITHGILKSKERKGAISINAITQNNTLIITISNTGKAISEHVLSQLKTALENNDMPTSNHIGLLNVNNRIKLIFGENYGLKIDSHPTGTTVTYSLPYGNE